MKTILYNPIFINPQAYYVFPRLTRYLQPDNESTAEPANYIGTIEVKVIAYGDTTLKRTYTNTDSIDLSEFKNTWIRISLFTKVGSCVLGEWKIGNMESDLPYIDPEVLASLKAVVIVGNKTNNDSDRAIVKNLVDPDNPFVISNAAFTEGSGYADKDSPYYGAFVTDGIDDLITSTKTVQEMLGGSTEFTAVSMVHLISSGQDVGGNAYTNYIRTSDNYWTSNRVSNIDKTGIYGYSFKQGTPTVINNILGDKNDYTTEKSDIVSDSSVSDLFRAKFSVEGFEHVINGAVHVSSVAWYWTIIANKVLTTDQINQVIAYFNLDRTLKPDILCDVKKQGITNENHAEFGDKLIDFSGNGRDIQLNNIAWKGGSGIAAKPFETIKDYTQYQDDQYQEVIIHNEFSYTTKSKLANRYWSIQSNRRDNESLVVTIITDKDCEWASSAPLFNSEGVQEGSLRKAQSVLANTPTEVTIAGMGYFEIPEGYTIFSAASYVNLPYSNGEVTVTFIPSYEGGVLLDGINDFGKVTGMPIYKDYTVVADYIRTSAKENAQDSPILSKSQVVNNGAFIFNYLNTNSVLNSYSFGINNRLESISDSERKIYYQSKYINDGKSINSGTGTDYNSMWLGTYRDNVQIFFNGAIYSLMSFPYSMSEFLIERQLKKHKLGTLYPDMVEFRPIIKHDDRITAIRYYHIKGSSWINLKPGDYIPVGSKISITTNLKSPYTIANVMSSSLTDIKVVPSAGGGNAYDILGYVTDKSPQKITMDIQVDSSLVQWNPVVESNVPYKSVKYYKLVDTSWKAINVGDYVLVGQRILTQITTVGIEDEVVAAVSEQLDIYGINKKPNGEYNILGITSSTTPQNINITIDEYIRYEDIVQPYPILLRFNDENGNEVSWGGKFRVGSTITRIGSIADPENNLLNGLYSVSGLSLNGKAVTSNTSIVEKQMVFKTTATYLLDNNEPKVILSPRLLRIPNSSYKLLGYIPDISGHGNHGVIHNSAYEEESGANGRVDCSFSISNSLVGNRIIFSDDGYKISFTDDRALDIHAYPGQATIGGGKARVTGMKSGSYIRFYTYPEFTVITEDGIYDIPYIDADSTDRDVMYFSNCKGVTIEGIGEYEGAYCLDGVDDHITIPTLSSGGKQVLMKVNWQNDYDAPGYMYDSNTGEYRNYIIKGNKEQIAYENASKTYIDGILNANLTSGDLKDITHNITSQFNNASGIPYIGCRYSLENFLKMSLYDFMLFDNISTGDKIKELNEYVGIEAKVELPPYYWDAYGKTNLDEDKATIQQRGIAVGDYDLTNTNFAYDKMSGFGGYSLGRFDKSWASSSSNNTSVIVVSRNPYDITLKKLGGNSDWEFNNTELKVISNPVSVKFKSNKNIRVTCDYHYYPVGGNSEGTPLGITSKDLIANKDAIITISPISQENIDKYNIDVNRGYYLIYFQLSSTLAVNEEVTIEMLPLYPNGLVYDGVTDYSENANIPALTDFTYVFKRKLLDNVAGCASMTKGLTDQQRAIVIDYINTTGGINGTSFGNMAFVPSLRDSDIIYSTTTNINGTTITKGNNPDSNGIDIGKFATYYKKMVFYKLVLYPKTIPLLQINFLKNLMEKDEIIDLNNKIFIQE